VKLPLDITSENLIKRIMAAASSHRREGNEAAMRTMDWEFIFDDFEGWCVLHLSTHTPDGYWIYPRLLPASQAPALNEALPSFSIHPSGAAYP
jgi:hypothetical protein